MLFGSLRFKNSEALVAISICEHSPRSRQGVNRIKNIEYIYKFRVEQKPFEVLKKCHGDWGNLDTMDGISRQYKEIKSL